MVERIDKGIIWEEYIWRTDKIYHDNRELIEKGGYLDLPNIQKQLLETKKWSEYEPGIVIRRKRKPF